VIRPAFGTLDRPSCDGILHRNHVGRIAFVHDRVDIEPIHYVYAGGWLYGRTSPGTKLSALQHNPWVAFEVDEIESATEWRSVVVHGTAYFLSAEGGDRARAEYAEAVETLRSFYPEALSDADVAPQRTVLFRVHVDEVTGRYTTRKP
jgi:uncharacterized protein